MDNWFAGCLVVAFVFMIVIAFVVAEERDELETKLKACQARGEVVCPLPTSCVIERQDEHTYVLHAVDCAKCAEGCE